MKVGVIDADLIDGGTRFPNLALMKISGFHGGADLIGYDEVNDYDRVYLSKVFESTTVPELPEHVICGGTGFDMETPLALPYYIEHHKPDYSLYQGHIEKKQGTRHYFNTSVGYTTRGCFRHCDFCVNKHYQRSVRWSPVKEFDDDNNKKLTLLDDNLLACTESYAVLHELIDNGKPFVYKQGLDIRLMTDTAAELLLDAPYSEDYIFAFDDSKNRDIILPKLEKWMENKPKRHTVIYLLTAFKSQDAADIADLFSRIRDVMRLGCIPYVMRYKAFEESPLRGMYIDIARWCNTPSVMKKKTIREAFDFLPEHYAARRYLAEFEEQYPEIAAEYFDMRYGD